MPSTNIYCRDRKGKLRVIESDTSIEDLLPQIGDQQSLGKLISAELKVGIHKPILLVIDSEEERNEKQRIEEAAKEALDYEKYLKLKERFE